MLLTKKSFVWNETYKIFSLFEYECNKKNYTEKVMFLKKSTFNILKKDLHDFVNYVSSYLLSNITYLKGK